MSRAICGGLLEPLTADCATTAMVSAQRVYNSVCHIVIIIVEGLKEYFVCCKDVETFNCFKGLCVCVGCAYETWVQSVNFFDHIKV